MVQKKKNFDYLENGANLAEICMHSMRAFTKSAVFYQHGMSPLNNGEEKLAL